MGILGNLEDIILSTKLPSWAIAAASTPFTFAATYFAVNQPGDAIVDAPPAAVAAVVALTVSYPIKWHFQDKATLKELGIYEKKLSGKKPEQLHSGIARRALNCLLQPKSSALFLTAALEAGRIYALGINDKILHSTSNLSDFVNYGIPAVSFEAGIAAVFGIASYHFVKPFYWAMSNGGKSYFGKFLKAALSRGQSQTRQLEEIAEEHPSQYLLLRIADNYIESGDFDLAAQNIKEAASLEQKQIFPGMGLQDFVSRIITSRYLKWRKNRENVSYAIEVAAFCNQAGSVQKADEIISIMTEANPTAEASAIAAWWAGNALGQHETSKKYWALTAKRLIGNGNYSIAPAGEGIHKVYRIGPRFIQDDIIMKEETQQDAEFESRMLRFVESIPKDGRYTSPKELAMVRIASDYLLVMSYLRGASLLEKARNREAKQEDIAWALDYLSLLHQYVPAKLSAKGKIDFRKKLAVIAESSYLGMPEEWQLGIMRNMEFIADGLTETTGVFSQDAHAGQWQYTATQLAKLDHNDNGIDSPFRDLAKLSGHPEMGLDADELERFQHDAFTAYRNAPAANNEVEFRIHHLDAMLFQALSFAAAWSVPEMQHMHKLRVPALSTTSVTMELLKENHWSHYRKNHLQYDWILTGLETLKEKLVAV